MIGTNSRESYNMIPKNYMEQIDTNKSCAILSGIDLKPFTILKPHCF